MALWLLGEYTIPKGTSIQSGLFFIMNDSKHFKDPEIFNPDRFIDPETGKFVSDETVIPFGLGKRNCLGQALGEQVIETVLLIEVQTENNAIFHPLL